MTKHYPTNPGGVRGNIFTKAFRNFARSLFEAVYYVQAMKEISWIEWNLPIYRHKLFIFLSKVCQIPSPYPVSKFPNNTHSYLRFHISRWRSKSNLQSEYNFLLLIAEMKLFFVLCYIKNCLNYAFQLETYSTKLHIAWNHHGYVHVCLGAMESLERIVLLLLYLWRACVLLLINTPSSSLSISKSYVKYCYPRDLTLENMDVMPKNRTNTSAWLQAMYANFWRISLSVLVASKSETF